MAVVDFPPDADLSLLEPASLDGAQALVVEAGWNQVRADWLIFLELGAAFKVAGPGGSVDATAATLPTVGGFGWISMVLVTHARRRQGIATGLLERCIARLRGAGLVSVLDATPAGRLVYQRLGFAAGWPISRWYRAAASPPPPHSAAPIPGVRAMQRQDLAAVATLDAGAFGCAREKLLAGLHDRSRELACVSESGAALRGYLLGRDGRNATQIGPLVAQDEATAIALLGHAIARQSGPLLIDVLDRHTRVAQALARHGFSIQRPYTRMTLDRPTPFGDARIMIAIAGPELG